MLDKDDAFARLCGLQRGGEACGACANHQHIAECGTLRIAVGVSLLRGIAKSCRLADEIFVDHPALRRPEKRLVIKTGRQELGGKADHRANIETQAGPSVLASGDKSLINKDISGASVGFGAATFADRDQRVWLLDSRSHDAARAVIFETAANHANAAPQQGGRQRIALPRLIGLAVEGEADHGRVSGPTARTALIALVMRWRVITSQARQP